jgi:hypothetical protein
VGKNVKILHTVYQEKKEKNKIDFRFKYYIKNQNGTKKIYIVPPPLILFYNN